MILERVLAAAGHEDHLLDPGLARFLDGILDERPVNDRQHFLGDRLGGRKETSAKTGNREDGLADGLHSGRSPSLGSGSESSLSPPRTGSSPEDTSAGGRSKRSSRRGSERVRDSPNRSGRAIGGGVSICSGVSGARAMAGAGGRLSPGGGSSGWRRPQPASAARPSDARTARFIRSSPTLSSPPRFASSPPTGRCLRSSSGS